MIATITATVPATWLSSEEILDDVAAQEPPVLRGMGMNTLIALGRLGLVEALVATRNDLLAALSELLATDETAACPIADALGTAGFHVPPIGTGRDLQRLYVRIAAAELGSPARSAYRAYAASIALSLHRPDWAACFLADAGDDAWGDLYHDLGAAPDDVAPPTRQGSSL